MRVFGVILLGMLSLGASLYIDSRDPEIAQYPLQIICPKCGYVFYNCVVDELFEGEYIGPEMCRPAGDGIPEILPGNDVACPFDGIKPYNKHSGGDAFYTNKGWMPRRGR